MKTKRPHHRREATTRRQALSWTDLLASAVREPGKILAAYRAFHEYSLGNQLAAYEQCLAREIEPGPLGTYRQWQERGRQVTLGAKALWLCVPRTVKTRALPADEELVEDLEESPDKRSFIIFSWQPRWFALAQTEGEEFVLPSLSTWDRDVALKALGITLIPFAMLDGNVQGYTQGRSVAINPLAPLPMKTLFHELAHVLLHDNAAPSTGDATLPRSLREVEAETVALLCCETLELPGAEFARGYIQHWLGAGKDIPERSAQRILAAADKVIRAGSRQVNGPAERTAAD
jgi:hypothetical protein